MNLGNRLAQWFTAEFGSTQCARNHAVRFLHD